MHEWVCMGGEIGRWGDGEMDGWMDGSLDKKTHTNLGSQREKI